MTAREHSRSELRLKLLARGYAEQVVEGCLDDLARRGLLSDARFVESYVEGRMRRGYGPHRIRLELKERGVEGELVDRSLDLGTDEWRALLAQAHDKKYGSEQSQDYAERVRRARFLEYRGFDAALVRRFLWSKD